MLWDTVLLAGMIVITAVVDWRLTLVVLAVLPLYALLARRRNRALDCAQRRARQQSGELSALTADLLARIPLVHVLGRADAEAAHYHQVSTGSAAAEVAALDASARFGPAADLLPGLGTAAVLVAGALEVTAGRLTLGGLLVFLAYLSSLTGPVRALAQLSTTITRGSVSRDRLAELLSHPVLQPAASALPAQGAGISRGGGGTPIPRRVGGRVRPAYPGLLARGHLPSGGGPSLPGRGPGRARAPHALAVQPGHGRPGAVPEQHGPRCRGSGAPRASDIRPPGRPAGAGGGGPPGACR